MRTVLFVVTIAWAVLAGGAIAVAMVVPTATATRLDTDYHGNDPDKYTWHGQPIVIERSGSNTYTVSCDVEPKNGENRTLRVQGSTKRYPSEFTSWFSGSATMTCSGRKDVLVYSGVGKQLYMLSENQIVLFGAVAIAFGPLLAVYVSKHGRRR